jgi:alpha-1,2-mannosyltransferase
MSVLQKRLLLAFALLLAAQTALLVAKYFAGLQEAGRFGGDFIVFWEAAQRVRAGDLVGIYDPEGWRRALALGAPGELRLFAYPPFALFGLWPLGGMSYDAAVLWWSLAPLPFYVALSCLLARRSGVRETAPHVVVVAATLPFLSANLFTGQTGVFVGLLLLAAACFWRDRPVLAGICIGLLAIKPQMGLLLPFALAAAGQWRAIASAGAMIVALVVGSTLWLGGAIWTDYLAMTQLFGQVIGQGYGGIRELVVGPYVSWQAVGAPTLVAAGVQGVVSLLVLAAIVRAFRDAKGGSADDGRLDLRLGLLGAGTLLATPYSLSYDTPVLALAMIPLIARAWRNGCDGLELVAVTALVVLPFAPSVLLDSHVPFAFCALSLAFCALYRRYQLEGGWASALDGGVHPGVGLNTPAVN